jgi:hypothetical protein
MAGTISGAENAGSDLLHLLSQAKVADDIQSKLFEAGVDCVKGFAALVADEKELRKLLKDEFGLDDTGGLAQRVKISKVVIAWDSARSRTARMNEMDGEAETRGEPKKVPQPEYQGMVDAYEKKHWEIEDKHTPGKGFMERRLEMVEKSSFTAEPLSEVLNKEEEVCDTARAAFDSKGNLVAMKVGNRVPLPTNPEQLRKRVALWGTSWIMAGTLHTNRAYLKGIDPPPLRPVQFLLVELPCHGFGGRR